MSTDEELKERLAARQESPARPLTDTEVDALRAIVDAARVDAECANADRASRGAAPAYSEFHHEACDRLVEEMRRRGVL